MHIHIAPVGFTVEPVLKVVSKLSGIDSLYLLHTDADESRETAEFIRDTLSSMIPRITLLRVPFGDFMGIVTAVCNIRRDMEGHDVEYSVNITGGTNLMAAAVCYSSFYIHARMYYAMNNDDPIDKQVIAIDVPRSVDAGSYNDLTKDVLLYILECRDGKVPVTNSDIAEHFGMNKQKAGYHVRILVDDGLVVKTDYRSGGRVDARKNALIPTVLGTMQASILRHRRRRPGSVYTASDARRPLPSGKGLRPTRSERTPEPRGEGPAVPPGPETRPGIVHAGRSSSGSSPGPVVAQPAGDQPSLAGHHDCLHPLVVRVLHPLDEALVLQDPQMVRAVLLVHVEPSVDVGRRHALPGARPLQDVAQDVPGLALDAAEVRSFRDRDPHQLLRRRPLGIPQDVAYPGADEEGARAGGRRHQVRPPGDVYGEFDVPAALGLVHRVYGVHYRLEVESSDPADLGRDHRGGEELLQVQSRLHEHLAAEQVHPVDTRYRVERLYHRLRRLAGRGYVDVHGNKIILTVIEFGHISSSESYLPEERED